MKNKFIPVSVPIVLLVWLIGRVLYAEIYQWYCVLFSLCMIIYVANLSLRQKNLKYILHTVFYVIFTVYALWALGKVAGQAREYALMFSREHSCRPSSDELLKTNSGWSKRYATSPSITKGFASWGAVRVIAYRDNLGVLSYGLPIPDSSPTIALPKCAK